MRAKPPYTHLPTFTTRYPEAPIYAVGYSLGANLLVKYLGEEGKHGYRPLAGAVAVSNPWNFEKNTVAGGKAAGIVGIVLGKFYSLALTIGLRVRRLLEVKTCSRGSTGRRTVAIF